MVESYQADQEDKIILGFLQKPQNTLITTAPYTPSKIGGKPAWLVPEKAKLEERCQYCGYYKQFLMQLYANSKDPILEAYHRTLYVFTCLSPQCIGTQRAVTIHRTLIKNKNEFGVEFADEELFEEVQDSYQQQLIDRGLISLDDEEDQEPEEENKDGKKDQDIKIIFKEHMILNEPEDYDTTEFYLKESKRIKNKQPKQRKADVEDDQDEDEDDDEDQLEDVFLKNQANSHKDKRQIDKLVKKTLKEQAQQDDQDDLEGTDQAKIDEVEMKELEKLIKNNHTNYQQIDDQYKLCEVVCRVDPDQVLRYVNNREITQIEPLWMSSRNIIEPQKILPCERCGQARSFEFQIMPQLFSYIKELLLVDWSTIVFYTCHNPKCLPDYQNGEFFVREFSYIQFSDDFDKVQYGDDKQIEKQRQQKREQEIKEQKETKQQQQQQQEEQKSQKNTQQEQSSVEGAAKKKKKQTQKESQKDQRDNVNQQVQSQLQDLMNDLSFK